MTGHWGLPPRQRLVSSLFLEARGPYDDLMQLCVLDLGLLRDGEIAVKIC